MIEITPTQAGFPTKEVNRLMVRSMPFQMGSTSSQVYWELQNQTGDVFSVLANGNLDIPEAIHTQWLDDTIVENYVLSQLNLTRNI